MGLFRRNQNILGLDLGTDSIKAVEGVRDGDDILITGYGQIDVPSPEARPDALADLLRHCGFRTRRVATAVSGRSVIVRFLNMVDMPTENLKNAIRYEADKYIPFDLDDVVLDFHKLEDATGLSKNEMKVLLVAVKRDVIQDQVRLLNTAGLQPRVVDVDAFALGNAFILSRRKQENTQGRVSALVDIGASKTSINILRGEESFFAREVYMGGADFTSAIAKRFGIEPYEAEQLKRNPGERESEVQDAVLGTIEELGNEVDLSFDFFENQSDARVEDVFLSGGGSCLPGLEASLERIFERKTSSWDPAEGVVVREDAVDVELMKENGPALAVAVGLASRLSKES
ncbi:MAG: type IV pilus assembly protein PilM [Planctomycetota bacterium]